jgi:Excalibur calcium-binding domain
VTTRTMTALRVWVAAMVFLLAPAAALVGCGATTPPEKQEKRAWPNAPEHPIIRKPGVVVKCSDFTSRQEVFAAEQQGELTTADMANMDTDGDGIACNEPGTKFADKLRGGES